MGPPLAAVIGIDLGTSGCRGVAVDPAGEVLAESRCPLPEPRTPGDGWVEQDPWLWWEAVVQVLGAIAPRLVGIPVKALCVDGTSATLLLADADGMPLTPGLLYNDRRAVASAARVDAVAPPESPARGPGSSLSKLLHLVSELGPGRSTSREVLALHQSDWIAGRLTGRYGWSDWNNALKLGYDPEGLDWPDWVLGLVSSNAVRLPQVLAPGAVLGPLSPRLAEGFGLDPLARVLAGTTDSTAAVLATGARASGEAVTCLGSTLVLKVVSERPFSASRFGVYSHRFGDHWLVGGASNSGGAVLRRFFRDDELVELSVRIDPGRPSGLDYYPLPSPGERFPRADPGLAPRISPIPRERVHLLQGLLEGMARIEAEGYALLAALGAPRPTRVLTTGGGSVNRAWEAIRRRTLGVPVLAAAHQEAAYGAALLGLGDLGPRGSGWPGAPQPPDALG